jgi:hypothetical protein
VWMLADAARRRGGLEDRGPGEIQQEKGARPPGVGATIQPGTHWKAVTNPVLFEIAANIKNRLNLTSP